MGYLKSQPSLFRPVDDEFGAERLPPALRVGPRVFLLAGLACVSVFDPTLATIYGPFIATVVYLMGRPGRLRVDTPNILAVLLGLWAVASSAWSIVPNQSWITGLTYLSMAIIFIAARDTIRTVAQLRVVAIGYVAGCFVLAARVIAEARQGTVLDGRLTLEGLNINYAGYAFALGFAMLVLLWVTKRRTFRRRAGIIVTGAALTVGVQLSDTRGAFVGLVLMAVWLLLCAWFKRPPFKLVTVLVATVAVSIATGAFDRASLALEASLGRATGDWSGRLILWPLAREDWAAHFWVGAGASSFQHQNWVGVGAHNLILEVGTGSGVVGVALYVGVLWSSLHARPVPDGLRRHRMLIGSFVTVSAFSYLTGHWELAPAAWVGLAVFSRVGLLDKDPAMKLAGPHTVLDGGDRQRPAVSDTDPVAGAVRGRQDQPTGE